MIHAPEVDATASTGAPLFDPLRAVEDRSSVVHLSVDGLPRRPIRDHGPVLDEDMATRVEAKVARTRGDYAEFTELAASVRRWLALSGARDASATRTSAPELQAPHHGASDASWHDRADLVARHRPALLIDAEHITSEALPLLLETVRAAYGSPGIRRAYADWTKPGRASWFAPLRQHGVQPIHNFDTPVHNRSLIALTLEALDLVERYAVTSLVLVGDLGPALPLVSRLKAAGVKVAVIGPATNPDDLQRDADEFLDIASLGHVAAPPARGRHQA